MMALRGGPLSDADRAMLLATARAAIRNRVCGGPESPLPYGTPRLREPQGAFVTLRQHGQLRGCIGIVQAESPLIRTVADSAAAAAAEDPRFAPMQPEEIESITVEISALGPLVELRTPDDIVVGRHGLMVSRGPYRGLLLPQVAVEQRWDRLRFLQETCLKAGLEPDAWTRGARIQAFEAEVVCEK